MSQLSSPLCPPQLFYKGLPVVTTETLAQAYEVEPKQIRQNFANNKGRFAEGKHFYSLAGYELREFKNSVENFDSVKIARNVNTLTLWAERGAARHAKMLNSDKAWDMFELLEETFFRVASQQTNLQELSPDLRSELKSLVDAKLSMFPADIQGKARAEIWTRFNRHFRIAEYAQLPPEKMAEARAYIIELELRCLKSKETKETPALPAPQLFSIQTGQQEALRKLKEVLDTVRTSCHPGAVTMAMPPEARERYYRIHELYCASIDCLEAAYTILNTGNKLATSAGMA